MYTYMIWDFNGTVLNDTALVVQTENVLRKERNLPEITVEFYQKNFCFPIEDYYKNCGMEFANESFTDLAKYFMEIYQPASLEMPLRDGVKDFIIEQKSKGRKHILLSASQRDNLIEQTDHLGITDLFEEVLGLGDIYGISKIELATNWFERNTIKAYNIVVIGDTLHDFEVAQALKCACVLLTNGHNDRERLIATGAPVLENVGELSKVLG